MLRGADTMAGCLLRLPPPQHPSLRLASVRAQATVMLGRRADFTHVTIALRPGARVQVEGLPHVQLAYTLHPDGSLQVDLGDNALLPLLQSIVYRAADGQPLRLDSLDHASVSGAQLRLTGMPATVTITAYAQVRAALVTFTLSDLLLIGDEPTPPAPASASAITELAAPDLLALLRRSAPAGGRTPLPTSGPGRARQGAGADF